MKRIHWALFGTGTIFDTLKMGVKLSEKRMASRISIVSETV
jgi:hypothetical protein